MFYSIVCTDKPHIGGLRERTRPAHNAYLKQHGEKMHIGGPFEDDDGNIVGTLLIVNVESREEALSFTKNEPLHAAGVFESVVVRRWRQMQPEISPGANALTGQEAALQLKQEGQ